MGLPGFRLQKPPSCERLSIEPEIHPSPLQELWKKVARDQCNCQPGPRSIPKPHQFDPYFLPHCSSMASCHGRPCCLEVRVPLIWLKPILSPSRNRLTSNTTGRAPTDVARNRHVRLNSSLLQNFWIKPPLDELLTVVSCRQRAQNTQNQQKSVTVMNDSTQKRMHQNSTRRLLISLLQTWSGRSKQNLRRRGHGDTAVFNPRFDF